MYSYDLTFTHVGKNHKTHIFAWEALLASQAVEDMRELLFQNHHSYYSGVCITHQAKNFDLMSYAYPTVMGSIASFMHQIAVQNSKIFTKLFS